MSEINDDLMFENGGAFAQEALERLREWREARKRILQRIENLIAEAHGTKQMDDSDSDDSDEGEPRSMSLRECIKELADLSLSPPVTDVLNMEV